MGGTNDSLRVSSLVWPIEGRVRLTRRKLTGNANRVQVMASLLYYRPALFRLCCVVRFGLVGVLLLTSKDTKNLLQGILFLFLFLVLSFFRFGGLLRGLALSSGIGRAIRIVRDRFSVRISVLGRLLGLASAENVRQPRACRAEDVVAPMNLAILRGSRSGDVDLLARGRAIRSSQLQRLGVNQNGLDSFRRVEILDVTIARKQSGGLHELRKDWGGAGAAGQA